MGMGNFQRASAGVEARPARTLWGRFEDGRETAH